MAHVNITGFLQDFNIHFPPFWANAVAESSDILYDGMYINATNTNPEFFNQTVVWNTDGTLPTFLLPYPVLLSVREVEGGEVLRR
jgi:hypothetical protein